MHPAPSVILFTVLSGLGFGLLAGLGIGAAQPTGLTAFLHWGLGYALTVGGLAASAFHLGNPRRALLAFSQWRSSWLSREAWLAVATLLTLTPVALAAMTGTELPPALGWIGAALSLATVLATSMIYAQLATVPRWRHWTTPALFLLFALAGGAILTGQTRAAAAICLLLGAMLATAFLTGDNRFNAKGVTLATATGLGGTGKIRSFAPPHTGTDYVMREMIHHVGRKHAARLRLIAVLLAGLLPAAVLLALPDCWATAALATALHLPGAFAARWLFFAEAEHVVGLFYARN